MAWHVTAIRPEDVRSIWRNVLPILLPAIAESQGRIDAGSVFEWLTDGRYLLWVAHQDDLAIVAAFVTRETRYPRKSLLTIDLCGGKDLGGWLDEADRVFRLHSREAGLDGIELFGRSGWSRALKRLGWRQTGVMVET